MRILLVLSLLSVASQGSATALRGLVQSLVGKKLASSSAIVAKINEADEHGRNALHYAVILGDLPLVEFFLDNDANTQAVDEDGLVPLRYAERMVEEQPSVERMKIISIVLEKTRGINKGDAKGWRPMIWSLMAGDYERVIELRKRGADIFAGRERQASRGRQAGKHTAVWAAEHLQDDRAIKILAEDAPDEYFPVAVRRGHRKFVQALIEQGVDVNTRDKHGYSAAMRAAKAGRLDDLLMLINNGAKIDDDALFLAIYSGSPKLVKTILNHNIELANKLMINVTIGKRLPSRESIADVLNGDGVDKGRRKIHRMIAKAVAESSVSPLFATITKLQQLRETKNIRGSIFEEKADRNIAHEGLVRELQEALRQNDELIGLVAEHLPDDHFPVVIANGYQKIAEAMIARGIDVNVRDNFDVTAALMVTEAGHLDNLQMLIDNGAQLDTSVLLAAIDQGNHRLVETVLKHNIELANKLITDVMEGKEKFSKVAKETILKEGITSKGLRMTLESVTKDTWITLVSQLEKNNTPGLLNSTQQQLINLLSYSQYDEVIKVLAEHVPNWYYFEAIDKGYLKLAQAMIDRGLNPATAKNKDRISPMMKAASDGQVNKVQALVNNGAQLDSMILFLAISSGNPKLVETILEDNADLAGDLLIDLMYGKITPPHKIRDTIGDVLIGTNPDDNRQKIYRMLTKAVRESASRLPSFATIARLQLLKEITGKHIYSDESLFSIARGHDLERELREILSYADATTRMKWAVSLGDIDLLKQALADGADTNYQSGFRKKSTVLNNVVWWIAKSQQKQQYREMMTLILNHGANPNFIGDYYQQNHPIKELIRAKDFEGVKILLDYGADPNHLVTATYTGDRKIIELLITYGADVNSNRGKEDTPLKTAARLGQTDLVSRYLNLGAEIDDHDRHRGSAFTQAARKGHLAIVKILYAFGAQTNISCYYGRPIDAARRFGHYGIVEFLTQL